MESQISIKENAVDILKNQSSAGKRANILQSQIKNKDPKSILDLISYDCGLSKQAKIDLLRVQVVYMAEIEMFKKQLKDSTINWQSKAQLFYEIRARGACLSAFNSKYQFVIIPKSAKKIFCRPLCPAREPNIDEMEFPVTINEAFFKYDAFPCGRCKPMDSKYRSSITKVMESFDYMEQRGWTSTLIEQSKVAKLSKHHFNRKFSELFTQPPERLQNCMREYNGLEKKTKRVRIEEAEGWSHNCIKLESAKPLQDPLKDSYQTKASFDRLSNSSNNVQTMENVPTDGLEKWLEIEATSNDWYDGWHDKGNTISPGTTPDELPTPIDFDISDMFPDITLPALHFMVDPDSTVKAYQPPKLHGLFPLGHV